MHEDQPNEAKILGQIDKVARRAPNWKRPMPASCWRFAAN